MLDIRQKVIFDILDDTYIYIPIGESFLLSFSLCICVSLSSMVNGLDSGLDSGLPAGVSWECEH